jgi:predicted  nucleic acid-binding Zn-ribbon protein
VSDTTDHHARLNRVEQDVSGLRADVTNLGTEMTGLKSDVKGLGGILGRIEEGVNKAQEKAGRPNLIAVVSVLITIISIIVGGAWMISGSLAASQIRDQQRDRELEITTQMRNREMDILRKEIERLDRNAEKVGR